MLSSKLYQGNIFKQDNSTLTLSPEWIEDLIKTIRNIPHDKASIPQESLDLANKFRTSLFPWRGQFSPELVEILLEKYSQDSGVVLDPFVGSGTTLFEAIRKGLRSYGAEINPSAVAMAKTAQWANLTLADRKMIIHDAVLLAEKYLSPFIVDLFSYQDQPLPQEFNASKEELFKQMILETQDKPLVQNLLTNALIRYMGYRSSQTSTDFLRALQEHAHIVENMPYSKEECKVFHCDARSLPLPAASIDLIITSPPYINVFNYHQNNRPAMELLGWDLLNIARSEIGSNRKHRQNRFLTVVQYTIDILDTLLEMHRLLKPNGRAIIVIGRESSIRGVSFSNGVLVAAIALSSKCFHLESIQERKFVNKFGETIYEDILHLIPNSEHIIANENIARSIAVWSLEQAKKTANQQVIQEIAEAKERAATVQKSPLFDSSAIAYQGLNLQREERTRHMEGDTMKIYPTPHLEKLKATLTSNKLPAKDKSQVEQAIQHYEQWIADMDAIMRLTEPANILLQKMVGLLNEYRIRMDIDLIFNSQEDWLYRQKGQLKLDNSIIEEFLPRLIYPSLIPEISQMDVKIGPMEAFAAVWFDSSLIKPEAAGGLKIRTKDQDFAISRPLYLRASSSPDFENSVEQSTNLAYVAAECKTNLDKTMFQEACATARDLTTTIPSAKYFLLCEWLNMKPISSSTTPIDKVLILRKAKRINANIRGTFSTYKGRQEAKPAYIDFLNKNPYRVEVFEMFINYIRDLLRTEVLDEETVLERGYF